MLIGVLVMEQLQAIQQPHRMVQLQQTHLQGQRQRHIYSMALLI